MPGAWQPQPTEPVASDHPTTTTVSPSLVAAWIRRYSVPVYWLKYLLRYGNLNFTVTSQGYNSTIHVHPGTNRGTHVANPVLIVPRTPLRPPSAWELQVWTDLDGGQDTLKAYPIGICTPSIQAQTIRLHGNGIPGQPLASIIHQRWGGPTREDH